MPCGAHSLANHTPMKQLYLLFCLCTLCTVTGCSNDDEKNNTGNITIGIDTEGTSPYDMTIYDDADEGQIAFYDLENGALNEMILLNDQEEKPCVITFNRNQLLESIALDSTILVFSNYRDHLVDMVCLSGNQVEVHKDLKTAIQLDSETQASASLRSKSGILGGFENADAWLREKQDFFEKTALTLDIITNYRNIISLKTSNVDKIFALLGHHKSAINSILLVTDRGNPYMVATADVAFEAFKSTMLKKSSPWGWLLILLSNYSTYSDLCEATWLKIFEWYDKFNISALVNMGKGILETGQGELKATMSWGFYADMDLHAIEPSGEHLFFQHKNSTMSDGFLDRDNRNGGKNAMENIYWQNPPKGTYYFFINYYGASLSTNKYETGNCYLFLSYRDVKKLISFHLNQDETSQAISIQLPEGIITEREILRASPLIGLPRKRGR